jgi:hypothetical protein
MGYDSLSELLQNKRRIAVVTKNSDSFAKSSAIAALILYLNELEKSTTTLILEKPEAEEEKALFKKHSIEYIDNIAPRSYVISIDYTQNEIEKITQDTDEEQGKILFYIYPESGEEFNFDNVKFEKQGASFDGVVLFDAANLDELGEFYKKNKSAFKGKSVYSMNIDSDYCKKVTEVLRYGSDGRENKFNRDTAQLLLTGLVYSSEVERGSDFLDKNYSLVDYLVSLGASISEAIQRTINAKCREEGKDVDSGNGDSE